MQRELQNVGDLRNTSCLAGERDNGRVKQKNSNSRHPTYFKNKTWMTECWFRDLDIMQPNEHRSTLVAKQKVYVQEYQEHISQLVGKCAHVVILTFRLWCPVNSNSCD